VLIAARNTPPSNTALSCRFSSQANFTRALRAHAVMTPEADQADAK
jgi:AraC-like DNA-binding protein